MSYIWQVSKAKGGFKLRVIAKNGKCVATFGETYKNKAYAMRMADKLSKQRDMQIAKNDLEQARYELNERHSLKAQIYVEWAFSTLDDASDKVNFVG